MSASEVKSGCGLCAIVKDEGTAIIEWIAYHTILGFSRIVVYDNESGLISRTLLESLASAGIINHVVWDNCSSSPQVSAYNDFLSKSEEEWACFLDADEFLNLKVSQTIDEFLAGFDLSVAGIGINWRIFGSSGRTLPTEGLVIEAYVEASHVEAPVNRHIKTIGRVRAIKSMHIHFATLNHGRYVDSLGKDFVVGNGVANRIETSTAQVNHYVVKSRGDFIKKRARGNANRTTDDPEKYNRMTDQFFAAHDLNDEIDVSILRWLPKVKLKASTINSSIDSSV